MIVRWWQQGDLEFHEERKENTQYARTYDVSVETLARLGYTVVICRDSGDVLMALGVVPQWPGVGQAWASPTEHIRGHGLTAVRTAIQCLYAICTTQKFHRVQTHMPANLLENIKWIELLGFHRESVQKYACPDKTDSYTYVKFFGGLEHEQARPVRTRLHKHVAELFSMDFRYVGTPLT